MQREEDATGGEGGVKEKEAGDVGMEMTEIDVEEEAEGQSKGRQVNLT